MSQKKRSISEKKISQAGYSDNYAFVNDLAFELEESVSYCINTIDNLGFDENLDRIVSMYNPLSGPFVINTSRKALAIILKIEAIEISRDVALSSQGVLPEYLEGEYRKDILNNPLQAWKIFEGTAKPILEDGTLGGISINENLMIGCARCANGSENHRLRAVDVDKKGGNLDCNLVKAGTTLVLPCIKSNPSFYIGDVHYSQPDGELGGAGLEISAQVVFSAKIAEELLSRSIHLITAENYWFFGVSSSINNCIQQACTSAFKSLRQVGVKDELARLVMAYDAQIKLAKFGRTCVVGVGVSSNYFSKFEGYLQW